ncbi:MAG: hypothetical protein PUC82_00120 [bacterium]|nr:hypothetical protein [bacterium]
MPTRMDRYNNSEEKKFSRSDRNKDLYENLGNNTRYTNITDVTNANAIDLTEAEKNTNTREGYHQVKEFRNVEPVPRVKKELDDFNFLYQNRENRIYDVNRVLEEARKNRKDIDEKEEKRKLKDNSYNIVTSLTKEELEKYRQNRENKTRTEEEEKIHDLIDTIASKTLAGELDKATSVDLLSDLMATNILDRVNITPENKEEVSSPEAKLELSKEVLDKDQIEEIKKVATESKTDENSTGADSDFYTKSMDLSSEDFEVDPEFQEKKMPIILKIFLILLVVSALIIAGYFIWKNFS